MELPDNAVLLSELADNKSGVNCEYENEYIELDTLAVEVPEAEYGDSLREAKGPDFNKLGTNCLALWEKTRDLRVATYYTIAATCTVGLEGFKQGLSVIDYLIDDMWQEFYPQLDPDDDNDPTERINILHMLSPKAGSYNDPIKFITHLRNIKLFDSLAYTFRDYLIVQGTLDAETDIDPMLFQAEVHGVPLEIVQKKIELVDAIEALLEKISSQMNEKMGDSGYITLDSLQNEIKLLKKFYTVFAGGSAQPAPAAEPAAEVASAAESTASSVASVQPAAVLQRTAVTDIKSYIVSDRGDALMLIKKCSDFFSRTEPTSPLPFLLNRALRMADMNLLDIMKEIDENSVTRVREQLGIIQQSEN